MPIKKWNDKLHSVWNGSLLNNKKEWTTEKYMDAPQNNLGEKRQTGAYKIGFRLVRNLKKKQQTITNLWWQRKSVSACRKCRGRDRWKGRNTKGIGRNLTVVRCVRYLDGDDVCCLTKTSQICILKYMQFMSVILQESC